MRLKRGLRQWRRSSIIGAATLLLGLASAAAMPAAVSAQSQDTIAQSSVAAGGLQRLAQATNAQGPPPLPPISNKCPKGQCLIDKYVTPLVKTLAALVGVAVTISIVFAGIQYTTSADDPQKVSAAKQRIFNSLVALIAYFLLFAFLNWIIPGGLGV